MEFKGILKFSKQALKWIDRFNEKMKEKKIVDYLKYDHDKLLQRKYDVG